MIDGIATPRFSVFIQIMLVPLQGTDTRSCTVTSTVPFEASYQQDGHEVKLVTMRESMMFVATDVVPAGLVPHIREVA
jgi:hypothetical protein